MNFQRQPFSSKMELDVPATTTGPSGSVHIGLTKLQQTGLMISPNFDAASPIRAQLSPPLFPDTTSDELSRSAIQLKAQRTAKCHYCKKPGHKIRTCRFKRRRDKLRETIASLSDEISTTEAKAPKLHLLQEISTRPAQNSFVTNQETLCCSLALNQTNIDSCPPEIDERLNDLNSKSTFVARAHQDISSLKLMKCDWKLNVFKYLSLSWCISLSWLVSLNPFCLARCKRELLYLVSFSWITDLFSITKQQHASEFDNDIPRMVASCTIDNPQPIRGTYKLQSKPSIKTWKRKKKKRR